MKTLYLHIGHYKTGSSAIQKYCSDHAEELAENGLYYPSAARPENAKTNHGQLSLSLAHLHGFHPPPWYVERRSPDDVFAEFREDVDQCGQEKILVSSEEFFQLGLRKDPLAAVEDLKQRLDGFDVRIVMYIREPMSLLKSWFSERNKGPQGTRTFPVFFKKLNVHFLAQLRIYTRYADVFGADHIMVRTYVPQNKTHIADFLSALGQPHLTETDDLVVNQAVPIDLLEIKRIGKRQDRNFDDVTLSEVGPIDGLLAKAKRINRDFGKLAAKSDQPLTSALSVINIFRHHRKLTSYLIEKGKANDQEAVILRDIAYEAETHDLELALELMRTAQMICPNGAIIQGKVEEYERLLTAKGTHETGERTRKA